MTHHTDAERAEFPSPALLKKLQTSTEGGAILCGDYIGGYDLLTEIWRVVVADEAARRAPAAPVPQGWKLVPVEPTDEMLNATYAGQHCSDVYWDMLAAAPQPPEAKTYEYSEAMCGAAPKVDPIAWYVTGCSTMLDEHEAKADAKRCGGTAKAVPLYTEQQVRELLAAHGIGGAA